MSAISTDFKGRFAKLEKPVPVQVLLVMATIKKFGERCSARDKAEAGPTGDSFRRGAVFNPDEGDTYYPLKVMG